MLTEAGSKHLVGELTFSSALSAQEYHSRFVSHEQFVECSCIALLLMHPVDNTRRRKEIEGIVDRSIANREISLHGFFEVLRRKGFLVGTNLFQNTLALNSIAHTALLDTLLQDL